MNSVGGGMLSWFYPRCSVPLYQLTDRGVAVDCGRKQGMFSATMYSVIVLLLAAGYTYYVKRAGEKDAKYEPYVSLTNVWIGTVVLVAFMYLGIPMIDGYFKGNSFDGVQYQIQSLMSGGMSRLDAQREIGRTARTIYQADATRGVGGDIIAAGVLSGAIQGAIGASK
jgi:hypothetical protein